MQPHLVYSNNHIDPSLSYFLAVAVVVLAVGSIVFALQQMLHARRAAKVAEGAHHPHAPISPGGRFVAGVVEFAQGESVAVDVTVTQRGSEQSNKNGVTHQWLEVGRMVRARPFTSATRAGSGCASSRRRTSSWSIGLTSGRGSSPPSAGCARP